MPNLLATVWGRRIAFFLLYVTEGIPFGFTAVAVVTQMRMRGVGTEQLGLFLALLYFPWGWKWVAGPVVDLVASERLGRRRAWIVGCQLMMVATLLIAWPIDFTARIVLFTAVILVHNVFAAIQDVAIDALAVGMLPKEERGVANGLMFAGSYLGNAAGGAGVLFLSEHIAFGATFPFVCGGVLLVTLGVSIWLREPRRAIRAIGLEEGRVHRLREISTELGTYVTTAAKAMFGSVRAAAGLGFALLPPGAMALSLVLQSSLAVEFGMDESDIATLSLASTVLAAVGCIAGGWLSDRFGRRRMLALYVFLTAIPTLLFAVHMLGYGWIKPIDTTATRPLAPAGLLWGFWAACAAFALFQGLTYGARMALYMDLCDPAVAATQFTAYMAMMNLVISYTSTWQGYMIKWLGYPATLFVDACFGLVGLALLPLMKPRPPLEPIAPKAAF